MQLAYATPDGVMFRESSRAPRFGQGATSLAIREPALNAWGRPSFVVQGLEGLLPYDELRASAIDIEMAGVTIAICALEHLRSMKRAAGRPRDLVDLDDLDAAQPPQD